MLVLRSWSKKLLKYKGYPGIVEYDDKGKIFTGEVIGVRAVLTFEGRTPEELEDSFRKSIDLYLSMCKEDGISPDKPYSGRFNIRIPPQLHHDIALRAASEHKSLNEWTIDTFERTVKSE
jgi:predicted HicB family RNase H-like nuclease